MQRLEVSGAVRPLYMPLGVKGLNILIDIVVSGYIPFPVFTHTTGMTHFQMTQLLRVVLPPPYLLVESKKRRNVFFVHLTYETKEWTEIRLGVSSACSVCQANLMFRCVVWTDWQQSRQTLRDGSSERLRTSMREGFTVGDTTGLLPWLLHDQTDAEQSAAGSPTLHPIHYLHTCRSSKYYTIVSENLPRSAQHPTVQFRISRRSESQLLYTYYC